MGDRRLGTLPFLGVWAVLTGIQAVLLTGSVELSVAMKAVAVFALQLAKLPPTSMRLNDVGRRPSEALFLVMIPVVNVYGFSFFCLQGTPAPKLWEQRRARWMALMDWSEALLGGLRLAAKTAAIGVPVAVLFAVTGSLGGRLALRVVEEWCLAMASNTLAGAGQMILAFGGFLFVYTAIQYPKRETATRTSWFPSLACIPLLLIGGSMAFHASGEGMGPVIMMAGFTMAWTLWWGSVGGAAAAIGWVRAGEVARSGSPLDARRIYAEIASRTVDVSAAHGGVKHAVTIGMQVLIPGVYYAIQYAFVDMVVVLDPDRRALRRSADLTWGHRARLFQLFLVWFLVNFAMYVGIALALEPVEDLYAVMLDPRVFELSTMIVLDLVFVLTSWVLTLALLLMYQERIAREAASKEKRSRMDPGGVGEVATAPMVSDAAPAS